jgi:hypothetical protein
MLDFFKENLFWILVPFVLVVGGVLALLYLTQDPGADNGFVYNVF